jgi:hypothetical protein
MSLKTHHTLVLNILINLKLKEANMLQQNYKYYTYTKNDSNLNEFESLSNDNVFVLHSCLEFDDIVLLMKIFQAIIDRNFNNFMKEEDSSQFYENENQMNHVTNNLFNYKNASEFIQTHSINLNEKLTTQNEVINNISIHDECPEITPEFKRKKRKLQCKCTISNLYQLLTNMTIT